MKFTRDEARAARDMRLGRAVVTCGYMTRRLEGESGKYRSDFTLKSAEQEAKTLLALIRRARKLNKLCS